MSDRSVLPRKAAGLFLLYALALGLAALAAHAAGVVFRQYLRIAALVLLIGGLLALLLIWHSRIPREQKRKRTGVKILTAACLLLAIAGLFLRFFLEPERETVVERDGLRTIRVERSWIMFLERSYYPYENIFWYRKDPHCTESFDDGDPSQPACTDWYDENGELIRRTFAP